MATIDNRVGTGTTELPSNALPGKALQATIDFNTTNASADDVVQMLNIPAGTIVQSVAIQVETAEGGTLTVDVGDADDVDGYLDGVDGNAATYYSSVTHTISEGTPNTVSPAFYNGKVYAAAGVISIIPKNDADTAKITVTAFCIPVG